MTSNPKKRKRAVKSEDAGTRYEVPFDNEQDVKQKRYKSVKDMCGDFVAQVKGDKSVDVKLLGLVEETAQDDNKAADVLDFLHSEQVRMKELAKHYGAMEQELMETLVMEIHESKHGRSFPRVKMSVVEDKLDITDETLRRWVEEKQITEAQCQQLIDHPGRNKTIVKHDNKVLKGQLKSVFDKQTVTRLWEDSLRKRKRDVLFVEKPKKPSAE